MKRLSLTDTLVEEFKGKLISGEYKFGDNLGSQDELARKLGVSRPSLREAIKRLELIGIIESKQGLGTFIKKIEPRDFMNPLSSFIVIDKKCAFELLEARKHIEGSLAAMAALHATNGNLKTLSGILSSMRKFSDSQEVEEFVKQDVQFHYEIAKASNNSVLIKIVEILRDLLRQLIGKVFQNYSGDLPEVIKQTIEFHQHIFDAIRKHDPEGARRNMEEHLQDVQSKVAKLKRFTK